MDARTSLLERALEVFADRGYDAVGVQEIVEAAGVTKPTLYHYFGSKQGLLEALVETRLRPFDEALAKACEYRGDLPRTLAAIVEAYMDFAMRQPAFYRLLLSMALSPPESVSHRMVEAPLQGHLRAIERVFLWAARQHGNLRGRHQRLAIALVGLINAYIQLAWQGELKVTPQVVHEIVKLFSYGMYA
jgi:TetR/AcrR family transcriptional regulator